MTLEPSGATNTEYDAYIEANRAWWDSVVPTGAAYQSDRLWRLPQAQRELAPLMYSLLATKVSR